jgi:hypothetical protein
MPTPPDKSGLGQSPDQSPHAPDLLDAANPLEQYAALIRIRRSAAKRTAWALAFFFIIMVGVAFLLVPPAQGSEREAILGVLLLATLTSALLSCAWNHAILTNILDLIDVLRRQLRDRE